MHEFHGDLLIGGARLKSLHGELEAELPTPTAEKSHEWVLGGHLHLTPQEWESIGANRQYRLELDDGRAAQVVITRVIATATTVGEARQLASAGVDSIIAQGSEAGGHRGTFAAPAKRPRSARWRWCRRSSMPCRFP